METIGNTVNFSFVGTQLGLLYTGYSNRGDMEVYIDDTLVDTIDQYSAALIWQKPWESNELTAGTHEVRLVHASGSINDLDAVIFHDKLEIMNEGSYDSTDTRIFFKGSWLDYAHTSAFNGGTRYSESTGDTASFMFEGNQLSLLFTGYYNRGELQIEIDGQTFDLLNQFTLDVTWQNRWDGPVLPSGLHTVTLTHASGQITDVDAIIISNLDPLPAGTYDDNDARLQYSGNWTVYSSASAHKGKSRYSETIGNTVSFHFTGTQLSLLYTGLTNRGTMQVYIDGSLVDTINQYSSTLTWKKRWDGPALSPGQHKVRLVHASGSINDLDAVIVTDSTATVTPTATPTATITGTVTLPVTPGVTPIPTETPPPPLQSAEYFYDGDGNMVKAVVNDVVTYYPGRHYNQEVDNSVSTVKKFYTMGSTTIAVRTISGTEDVLNWVLGDHLGSASITANEDGSWNSELKYTAFGEVRASRGLTPTEYRYTGQMEAAEMGLYFYVARWYDPYLNHMLSPDSIIPDPVTPLDWDRYSYSRNNPIRYTDPSGHRVEEDAGYVAPYIRLISTNGCNYTERIVFENAARDVGAAYAREYNQTYGRIAKKMGDDFVPLSAEEAFLLVHDGPVFVERQSYDCSEGCWGRAVSQNKIYIYNNASTKNLVDYPKLLVHELGHVFENTLAQNGIPKLRWSLPSDMWNREGFKPRYQGWQFGGDDTNGEIFADMFVHWTYGEWARGISGALTASAAQKAGFMRDHMASSILSAFH